MLDSSKSFASYSFFGGATEASIFKNYYLMSGFAGFLIMPDSPYGAGWNWNISLRFNLESELFIIAGGETATGGGLMMMISGSMFVIVISKKISLHKC